MATPKCLCQPLLSRAWTPGGSLCARCWSDTTARLRPCRPRPCLPQPETASRAWNAAAPWVSVPPEPALGHRSSAAAATNGRHPRARPPKVWHRTTPVSRHRWHRAGRGAPRRGELLVVTISSSLKPGGGGGGSRREAVEALLLRARGVPSLICVTSPIDALSVCVRES